MPSRRALMLCLAVPIVASRVPGAAAQLPSPAEHQRQLDAWWARQRERERAQRFRDGPNERLSDQRMPITRRWEEQNNRRRGWPDWPF